MHNETQSSLPWNTGDVPDTLVPAGILAVRRGGTLAVDGGPPPRHGRD